MRKWHRPRLEVLLFADFNCVQSPHLDRLGGLRSVRPKSPELKALLQVLGLEDAHTLVDIGNGRHSTEAGGLLHLLECTIGQQD